MKKLFASLGIATAMVLATAGIAQAHHVTDFDANCDTWSVSFAQFHEGDTDIVVTVDGVDFPQAQIEGDATITGDIPEGAADDGSVTVSAAWNHDNEPVNGGSETFQLDDCATPTTPPPTTPPPTTPPPTHQPGCHADHSCHTRTMPPPHRTAFTGADLTGAYIVFGSVLMLAGVAFYLRRRYSA